MMFVVEGSAAEIDQLYVCSLDALEILSLEKKKLLLNTSENDTLPCGFAKGLSDETVKAIYNGNKIIFPHLFAIMYDLVIGIYE